LSLRTLFGTRPGRNPASPLYRAALSSFSFLFPLFFSFSFCGRSFSFFFSYCFFLFCYLDLSSFIFIFAFNLHNRSALRLRSPPDCDLSDVLWARCDFHAIRVLGQDQTGFIGDLRLGVPSRRSAGTNSRDSPLSLSPFFFLFLSLLWALVM